MDKDRQIRFLYPPLVLVGFWLLAVKLDPNRTLSSFLPNLVAGGGLTAGELIAVITGGGAVVLVAGYLIGVVSVVSLRVTFAICRRKTYEVQWSRAWHRLVAKKVGLSNDGDSEILYLVAILDHLLIPKEMHSWVFRRWSAFNVAIHSCAALVLALVLVYLSGLSPNWEWTLMWLGSLLVLATQSVFAWRDTMGMLEFLSQDGLRLDRQTDDPPS